MRRCSEPSLRLPARPQVAQGGRTGPEVVKNGCLSIFPAQLHPRQRLRWRGRRGRIEACSLMPSSATWNRTCRSSSPSSSRQAPLRTGHRAAVASASLLGLAECSGWPVWRGGLAVAAWRPRDDVRFVGRRARPSLRQGHLPGSNPPKLQLPPFQHEMEPNSSRRFSHIVNSHRI